MSANLIDENCYCILISTVLTVFCVWIRIYVFEARGFVVLCLRLSSRLLSDAWHVMQMVLSQWCLRSRCESHADAFIPLKGSDCRSEEKGHLVVGVRDRYMRQLAGQSPVMEQTPLGGEQSRLEEPQMLQVPWYTLICLSHGEWSSVMKRSSAGALHSATAT